MDGCTIQLERPDAIDVECHKDLRVLLSHVVHEIFGVRHGFNPVHACIGNIGNIQMLDATKAGRH